MKVSHPAAVGYALTAALCYGLSAPFSKLLLEQISPSFLAALLYLGAGLGMWLVSFVDSPMGNRKAEIPLDRKDLPLLTAMVLLDTAAPILLLLGLSCTTPATVSLLNNFEIVATALIACWWFKEKVGKRLWMAILLITWACILLTVDDFSALSFSPGAVLALSASICWGFENNTTRLLSAKNPIQIVIVKGFGSGSMALLLAAFLDGLAFKPFYILGALALGALAYGCSVYFYILAQRQLGAARTGIYYAFAPFMGVLVSFMVIGQTIGLSFCAALSLMILGSYLAATEESGASPKSPQEVPHSHFAPTKTVSVRKR